MSNDQLIKPHAGYSVDCRYTHISVGCILLNRTDCYVWIRRKNLYLLVLG